jgi:hypothetical protein
LQFSEVRWDKEGQIMKKLHLQEVILIEGKSADEIHDLLEAWYLTEIFEKGRGYSYRFHGVSGDFMWQSDTKKPFLVNEKEWIIPKAIKCEACMIAWANAKLKDRSDGVYGIDLRIKDGRVLVVVADHFTFRENSFLSDWLLKRDELVDRPDPRIEALEIEFQKLKTNIIEFVSNYKPPVPTPIKKDIDEW